MQHQGGTQPWRSSARGHGSGAGATEITEATGVGKEVLQDLLCLLSGRELIIYLFLFKLSVYF